jgi:hypothetical protein
MSELGHALLHAVEVIGSMTWQIAWSLILGFTLSAVIESLVHKSTISRLLPDGEPRSLATAAGLGAASSSCSYAAVAIDGDAGIEANMHDGRRLRNGERRGWRGEAVTAAPTVTVPVSGR